MGPLSLFQSPANRVHFRCSRSQKMGLHLPGVSNSQHLLPMTNLRFSRRLPYGRSPVKGKRSWVTLMRIPEKQRQVEPSDLRLLKRSLYDSVCLVAVCIAFANSSLKMMPERCIRFSTPSLGLVGFIEARQG